MAEFGPGSHGENTGFSILLAAVVPWAGRDHSPDRSTIGSILGQVLGLSTEWVKTLVACGAAGGISATFNAPLAGIFFAHEVILGRIFTRHFGFVVIASVISDAVAHAFLGNQQSFAVPNYTLSTNWELVLYFILGAAALHRVFLCWFLYKLEDVFEGLKIPKM